MEFRTPCYRDSAYLLFCYRRIRIPDASDRSLFMATTVLIIFCLAGDTVAKLEVVLVVLGTSKHFSKKIIFYCLKKISPKILKMIHGTLASSIKCEILSNPVMLALILNQFEV